MVPRNRRAGKPIGTGAGWAINWVGGCYSKQGKPLGDTQEVYDAEARAILGGRDAALKSPMSPKLQICLDNLSVARNAGLTPKGSSQEVFKRFREAARNWLQTGRRMSVQWIPGHMGIEGNEIADKEAKSHAKTPPNITSQETQSPSNAKRLLKTRKDEAWQQEWQADISLGATKTYRDSGLKPTTQIKSQPELSLKRGVLGWLIAARSGHGHFADYHERFGHEEADLRCECGHRRTPSAAQMLGRIEIK